MNSIVKILVVNILLILSFLNGFAQTDNEFWFCVPQLTAQHEKDEPKLFLTNATDSRINVTIEMPRNTTGFAKQELTIEPHSQVNYNFKSYFNDESQKYDRPNIIESGLCGESCEITNKGIHITATGLITAYLQRGNTNNCDIWALKGKNAYNGADGKIEPEEDMFIVPLEDIGNCDKAHADRMKKDCGDNKPAAWYAVDIVAVEDGDVTVTLPTDDQGNITLQIENWGTSNPTRTFPMQRGQTLNLQAASQDKMAKSGGGIVVTSTGKIAVQWKDDSLLAKYVNESEGGKGTSWDAAGDQLVPVSLAGTEYIVMRGQLANDGGSNRMYENVYFMSTVDEPTTVQFKTDEGDVITSQTISGIGSWGKLLLNSKNMGIREEKNYNAVYIKSDNPIIVWHISGSSGAEVGGAILPTINGCTGSEDVTVCRSSTQAFGFWLNIMCKQAHIKDFIVTVKGTDYPLPESWFKEIPGTGWYYLKRDFMKFGIPTTKDNHGNYTSNNATYKNNGLIPSVGFSGNDAVIRVRNTTGIFHLAVINGDNSGSCQYGYFSNFDDNTGSAVINDALNDIESEYSKFCDGDTVTLVARGGLSYAWKFIEKDAATGNVIESSKNKTFIEPQAVQMASDKPKVIPLEGFNQYQVTIQRRCYMGTNVDTTIDVWALGYPRAKSDFTVESLTDCSPAQILVTNTTNENGKMFDYTWTLTGGGLKTPYKSTAKNLAVAYDTTYNLNNNIIHDTVISTLNDTITFKNLSNAKHTYKLTLEASLGSNCPDKSAPKSICVNPVITAIISADPVKGCTPLDVEFENKSTGPYTKLRVNFGDGSGWIDYPSTTTKFKHIYKNPSIKDTTYWAKINVIDELNGSCDSEDSVLITVFGKVESQYIINQTSGCSPLLSIIENTTIGDPSRITYTWTVGSPESGTVKDNGPFTLKYTNNGTTPMRHTLQLKAVRTNKDNSTCESLSPKDSVTVYPEFTVDYSVLPIYVCDSSEVTFENKSSDLSSETNFRWIFGDGSTDNSHKQLFDHLYYHTSATVQEYETKLIGESKYGCRDTASNGTVTVMPYLNPHFTLDKVEGCSPLIVKVENNTPGHAYKSEDPMKITCPQGVTYELVEGSLSGLGSTIIKFVNQTGSKKEITITLTDKYKDPNMGYDCQMSYSRTITVYPEIKASIEPDKTEPVCDSSAIKFTNSTKFVGVTTSPADYIWAFGDGTTTRTSDNSSVTHIYGNNTGSTGTDPQRFTATLIAMANGCADTATTTVDVYPPVRAAFSSGSYNICAPDTIAIKNRSVGANKYEFSFDDGTDTAHTNTLDDVAYIVNNATASIVTKKVTLTAKNGECSSTTSKSYTAYPVVTPKLAVSLTEGCGPLDVTVDRSATTGANTFKIDFGDGISDETGIDKIAHTFDNKTGSDVAYTVRLTATNSIGCKAEITDTVTVFPEIKAAFSFEKSSECSPMDVKLINNSLNGSKFVWSFGDGTADEEKTTKDDFNHKYAHNNADGNDISTYEIGLLVVDANHSVCRDVATKTIKVYPKVIADFKTENDEGCSPLTTTFTNQSEGYQLTYKWEYDHDNLQSAVATATHTHTFDNIEAATHTYNIKMTATDINGCQSTATKTVKAYPHVVADFTYVKDASCTPYPVTFSYPAAALNGNKFEWDFGFGGNKATKTDKNEFDFVFDNTDLNAVKQYNIKLVSTDTVTGCSDNKTKPIEVYPQLKPAFTQDIAEGCNPLPVKFTNQTTGLADYLWDFGDSQSSAETSPEHLFKHYALTDQTYKVVLKATQTATGCEKTADSTVTVYSYVLAKFGINEKDNSANGAAATVLGGCTPFDVTITDSSRLTNNGTWRWDFGDGETSTARQPRSRTYTNPDKSYPLENKNYTIKLVVANDHGCQDDTAQTIAVYPRSIPDFDGNFAGCEPLTVTFEDKSVVDNKSQYFWTFSDGSTIVDQPPFSKTFHNYDYENNREFTATLKTTTEYNCTDSTSKKIVVYAKPLARFIPLIDRACPPFVAEFKNSSIGKELTFDWDFGNGTHRTDSSSSNQSIEYLNDTDAPITFNVGLVTKSEYGCLDTMVNPMITFPNVKVDFSFEPTGCSPHTINIKNKSSKSVVNHLWNFGDGSTSVADAPTYTYFNTTDNDQVLTITYVGSSKYQCTDTIKKDVTVYINPNVDFVADAPSQRYPDDTVYFVNYTQDGPWEYEWNFGDGKSLKTKDKNEFMHKYGTWAPNKDKNLFKVTLNVQTEHCRNKVTHDVEILPPYPRIEILNNSPSGCVPFTVQFKIDQEYCNTFEWNFEDGTTSTDPEPEHEFTEPGIYNVKLTAEGDGGSHYDYEIITVHSLPEPDFTTSPKYVMLPDQPVQFFNSTRNGHTYIWDFGDGEYSTQLNPYHQYTKEGFYDVKLIAFSEAMCVDSIIKYEEVEVSGAGFIKYPNAFIPSAESPLDGTYPTPDDVDNVFHPIWHGVKEYDLWIFNRWGEQLFHSTDVNVGWNGRYANNGTELGQDVYFWKAKGKFENNVPFKLAGDVTLIRR